MKSSSKPRHLDPVVDGDRTHAEIGAELEWELAGDHHVQLGNPREHVVPVVDTKLRLPLTRRHPQCPAVFISNGPLRISSAGRSAYNETGTSRCWSSRLRVKPTHTGTYDSDIRHSWISLNLVGTPPPFSTSCGPGRCKLIPASPLDHGVFRELGDRKSRYPQVPAHRRARKVGAHVVRRRPSPTCRGDRC